MTRSEPPFWRQIQKKNFTKIEALLDYLELAEEERQKVLLNPRFPLNVPLRLAAKMEKNRLDDPIARQFIPLKEELTPKPNFVLDPVQDLSFRKTKKMLHKYHSRALLVSTSACAMNCRFCFRQNFPYEVEEKSFGEEIAYIRENPDIQEVILSGGDPLSLSDSVLENLLEDLEKIPHIQRIRFHTRFPVGIPERIDASFLSLLENTSKQLFFILHANHPRELDSDVLNALKSVQKKGIPVLNQSTLLKGVNDDEKTLLALSEKLLSGGILPYYLHALDPVQGAAHFETPDSKGRELIRYVQTHLSGFGVPRFVREEPGMPSKTFITP